ncbi:hypothetical protein Ade02nite_55020 [Paractinoplanes deccanensis]|uniref:Uncharacterized protein n=1 Tax=Paractinoplanes deccanensis TaxID=113561 RepID=A0ABQ3YA84_9ACTN|nr:hypothetical protein [Actinoplanes deccanensis]GID76861.1 hypothetical protein Ade02nite_55020 [Actinoplanes deccanensis]
MPPRTGCSPRESWPPWHVTYDQDLAAAWYTPKVVQRAAGVPNLLGLAAAGVGATRSIRRTGVVSLPPAGDDRLGVVAGQRRTGTAAPHVAATLTGTADLTSEG